MDTKIIDSFITEYNEFLTEFTKRAQQKLKEVIAIFWEENPGVNVITWTQYAPYFNDGEPCEFGVGDVTYSNATSEDDISELNWGEYNGETEGVWGVSTWGLEDTLKDVEGVNIESIKQFSKFINSNAMEDVLETLLGSDNKVVITRAGIVSEDYSGCHD